MTDVRGGARLRINVSEGARWHRMPRPVLYLAVGVVVFPLLWLLDRVAPGSVSALDVGFTLMEGLLLLVLAGITRKLPARLLGIPLWLGCLVLSACFFAIAIMEMRGA